MDTLACALGAYDCEQVQIGRRLAPPVVLPHKNAGRILGFRDWTTAEEAAFVNTAMIRNWDWNDVFPGSHPSDCLGAFFALAEPAGADGRTFLTSTVIAYEVITRLAASTQLRRRGWDQGFGIGISTVAGLGHMFRLPFEAIANAVAIITVANVPFRATRAGKLSLWKGSATSFATRNAAFATLLAAEGMTGPDRPFEGRHGLWDLITGPFEMEPFGGRGGRFTTPTVRLKYWPAENSAQAAIWAALELRSRADVGELTGIDVFTDKLARDEIASEPEKWDPQTRETADHSLPYIFAKALLDGTINLASFEESAYLDPSIRPLMAKIRVHVDPEIEAAWPAKVIMRVEATTAQGKLPPVEVVNPRGHEDNPMQDRDTDAKFRTTAVPVLGAERAEAALSAWWKLGEARDLTKHLELLRPKAS